MATGTGTTSVFAQGPSGAVVRAGDARVTGEGTASTRIDQRSQRAIIDWRNFSIGPNGEVIFAQPNASAATLNRVTGEQVSLILGRLEANGTVLLMNPNGIVFGGGSQVNVGSLIASTANIGDDDFMDGKLAFTTPGSIGAGILNRGSISARDGGLVALVAPHVRNDGVIAARLGKVVLGSGDTFTVDLYGDALISLALSPEHAGQLRSLNGEAVTSLVTNTGRIDTAGGQTVLMTARGAKGVLDSLINMSGVITADTAVEQNGKILLLGEGGRVDVSGTMTASSGTIDVLGDTVHLANTASLDASGATSGGTIHVGGAFQGSGDTYRAKSTTVDAGATLKANATDSGNGGEVVVWSDGHTNFAGRVEAKGGANSGNGGRMEVSGKQTLSFLGDADASAANGHGGSLLLDPAFLVIGVTEAANITRVLRTGTTATLQADNDITVNSAIIGGDREQGGGLTVTAGQNIFINDFIVTNNGALNFTAQQGTVAVALGKALFAGTAPISITAGGSLRTAPLVTSGALALRSTAGSVFVDSFIDEHTGPVSITAAGTVDINQPIVSLANGSTLTVQAGTDVNVNAQVDGRGGVAGGAVQMTAGRDVNVNQAVVTNNGAVALTATGGSITTAAGTPVISGSAATSLTARNSVTTGPINAGTLAITATTGSANINGVIDSNTGATTIAAGTDVNINQAVLNGQTGKALAVTAGRDVNVNAVVDGRGGVAGGTVALTGGRSVNVNDYVLTNNAAIGYTANGGDVNVAAAKATVSGTGAITMRASGNVNTGGVSGGSLSATATGGSVTVNGVIDGTTGKVDLSAGTDVTINQAVLNTRTGNNLNATAGRDVVVNAAIDGRGGATGGAVQLTAGRDARINSAVVTNNGKIGVAANGGALTMGSGSALVSGNQTITLTAKNDITTQGISGGSLNATSTAGAVNVNGIIDGSTGRVDLTAYNNVNINAAVLNTRSGASFNATSSSNVVVNAAIDGTGGTAGGAVNLLAKDNVALNASIATNNGAVSVKATNGTATFANGTGLYAGTGAVTVDVNGNLSTGVIAGGPISVMSRSGAVSIDNQMAGSGGAMSITAANAVTVNSAVTNPGLTSPLTITAGTDLTVNAAVGRTGAGVPSSAVTLVAGQNVTLNESVETEDADIAVTATSGTVTTAASKGLFAGTGDISVTSGQTLSTGITSTTGTVSLRSTAGDVNVDTAIAGTTGAVTIQASNDVNVNQGIANVRADAPLSLTAGRDINVNAKIDGRNADPATQPSGSTTLTANRDVNLGADIVTVDAALSVTATTGSVNWNSNTLHAGNGTISVTSGADLNTGAVATTGALNYTSTGGDVNIATKIAGTVGDVTIDAARDVNVNQQILNLKSGADLGVTAGRDITVNAQIDGGAVVTGGAVTMVADRNLTLNNVISTNDGAVDLTATNGSVILPVATETVVADIITVPMNAVIDAGSGNVSITSGGDFNLTSPVLTTGSLTIESTGGDVTTSAPIAENTGAVTITAADALVVNREIRTANQAIVLNAGAGGITVNQIVDHDQSGTASVNAGTSTLTLNSGGNVAINDIRGITAQQSVTIDARGRILNGKLGVVFKDPADTVPEVAYLNADGGIDSFNAAVAKNVYATSSSGSINIDVANPAILRVTTGTPNTLDCPTCNITVNSLAFDGSIGADVVLNAGGSVVMPFFKAGTATFIARSGDVSLDNSYVGNSFTIQAGRDLVSNSVLWVGSAPTQSFGGPLSITVGRDIALGTASQVHVGNGQSVTMVAGRNLQMYLLEALGAVSLTATTGDITVGDLTHLTDIGASVLNTTGDRPGYPVPPNTPAWPDFNPTDLGVASLAMTAGGNVTIFGGARAVGNINITAGGNLTTVRNVYSTTGTVTLNVAGTTTIGAGPVQSQLQVDYPVPTAPVGPPGPKSPIPGGAGPTNGVAPGLPPFAEIPVSTGNQNVGGVIAPASATGTLRVAGGAGAVGAPGASSGSAARPAQPTGPGAGQASGSSAPGTADTAAALRTAGESCGEAATGDTGLDAVAGTSATTTEQASKNATCATTGTAAQAAPAGTTPDPNAPAQTPAPVAGAQQQ